MAMRVVMTESTKGGVGKSSFTRALLDHVRRHAGQAGFRILALDGQPEIGHLMNFYGIKDASGRYDEGANVSRPFEGVLGFDAASDGIDMLGRMFEWEADIVVVDMPGGMWGRIGEVYGGFEEYVSVARECGCRITVAIPLDNLKATAEGVHQIADAWGEDVDYVVVLNEAFVKPDRSGNLTFPFYNGPSADQAGFPADRIARMGGVEFRMPALQSDTFALVDKRGIPLTSYACDQNNGKLHPPRVESFLKKFDAEAERKLGLFTPEQYAASKVLSLNKFERAAVFDLAADFLSKGEGQ